MVMVLVKARNAAGLFWDSLDDQERSLVIYGAVYVVANALLVLSSSRRRRQRDQVLDVLTELGVTHAP